MTTINGLPAHILLVHAVVVLLPLAAILLVLTAAWPAGRRRLAGPNAILSTLVLILVPITTDAGEWLEQHVENTAAVRSHVELGDAAIYVAIPVMVLALVIWWRTHEQRFTDVTGSTSEHAPGIDPTGRITASPARRTFLAPANTLVTTVVIVVSVLVAGATLYLVYRIGDSGAAATWRDAVSATSTGS